MVITQCLPNVFNQPHFMLLNRTSLTPQAEPAIYRPKSEERLHRTPTLLSDIYMAAMAFVVVIRLPPECGFAVWNCDARGDESQQHSGEGGRERVGTDGGDLQCCKGVEAFEPLLPPPPGQRRAPGQLAPPPLVAAGASRPPAPPLRAEPPNAASLAATEPVGTELSASPLRISWMPPCSSWLCSTERAAWTAGWVLYMASRA